MSGLEEAEQELQKVEEVLAMAEHVIEASRQEQERLSLPVQLRPEEPQTIPTTLEDLGSQGPEAGPVL